MTAIKLNKRCYSNLEYLMHYAGATQDNNAFPSHVYASGVDYKLMQKCCARAARKEYPKASTRLVEYSVGMYMLNLGPNTSLGNAIRPGWVLVDTEGIAAARRKCAAANKILSA